MTAKFIIYAQNLEDVRQWRAFADSAFSRYLAQLAASAQHMANTSEMLAGPANAPTAWRGRLAASLARLARRKREAVSAEHAAQGAQWRAARSPTHIIAPEWRDFPLAHGDAVAELAEG